MTGAGFESYLLRVTGVRTLELQGEGGVDLEVAQQERAFVESLAAQPAGDLGVALAGIA
jgi:hypothetical protein